MIYCNFVNYDISKKESSCHVKVGGGISQIIEEISVIIATTAQDMTPDTAAEFMTMLEIISLKRIKREHTEHELEKQTAKGTRIDASELFKFLEGEK